MKLLSSLILSVLAIQVVATNRVAARAILHKPRLAITMDDPNTTATPLMSWKQRNQRILEAMAKHQIKAALFVCGMRVADNDGKELMESWDSAGHIVCNHSWSHWYYPAAKLSALQFINDVQRSDSLISPYHHYTKLFRFPYLKEGNTAQKRDSMRLWMKSHGYTNGYVSIDASDWYVDEELRSALKKDSTIDITPYKEYYIHHLLDRARYYDSLAHQLGYTNLTHTLLIHHSLLNALFLDDVLSAFKAKGWELADAADAYKDNLYQQQPDVLPAGESILWALAKKSGKFEKSLRYPAEDAEYEKEPLSQWLKEYRPAKKHNAK